MPKFLRVLAPTFVALAALATAGTAIADAGAIKHRQAVMKAVGGHTGAIASVVKGEVPYKEDVKGHAHALVELAKIAGKVFPKGSHDGDTGALPVIWEKPDAFKKSYGAFVAAAENMAKAAETGDMGQIGAALGGLGKSCKGCHDDFRKKK